MNRNRHTPNDTIQIRGAREGQLKSVDLDIPRERLVVFTGLSGSGKSTLVETIFRESQRQYLEAVGYQGIRKPNVDRIRFLSSAIRITQSESNRNPRSTVGTKTNIYTDLRMLYEKLGERDCPHCGERISAADCRETTTVIDGEFRVYMDCSRCGQRMDKLTRSHFSANTREGACPDCQGLGSRLSLVPERCIDASRSPQGGAVDYWAQAYQDYQVDLLHKALAHYGVPADRKTPVGEYGEAQTALLHWGADSAQVKALFPQIQPPKSVSAGRFEGVLTTLWRRMSEKEGDAKGLNRYFDSVRCASCAGERLNPLSRSVTVAGRRLPELSVLSLEELGQWLAALQGGESDKASGWKPGEDLGSNSGGQSVRIYLEDLRTKISRLERIGLGYLSIDRQMITLSGGESQRIKLAAALDSDLTGMMYLLDEPTIGLHPRDTEGVIAVLQRLRDLGNSVLVIEHDPEVMRAADHIVDLGPGSGRHGGRVVAQGTLAELMRSEASVTGAYLKREQPPLRRPRQGDGASIGIASASLHNLQEVNVRIPTGCLVAVTGVSGSGKSSLIFGVLAAAADPGSAPDRRRGQITGLEAFDRVVTIRQSAITRMKRSNVATYSEAYGEIRKLYGSLEEARARGLSAKSFSFNTPGGRCENCEGLGTVTSSMLFFENIEEICHVCGGRQFSEDVLAVTYLGRSIHETLRLPIEEAATVFERLPKLRRILHLLNEVGLGYLELGQTLTTLSGGEAQRLKLASELLGSKAKRLLYLMDEPTTGLHPADVDHFLKLLHAMVDSGSTVIIVEHNMQVVADADWVVDLGPEGGVRGGQVGFSGKPADLLLSGKGATAEHLGRPS
ncbi:MULTISPECIES: ATP-binding cassette domain-containing protein [Saccharibacillus]|uniref:ATP-binding cassette domain-containing protein n=1 Tax=Saccharibacillus TaxID=456492 RepID=UPI00123A10CF|nr:excinuclease ABC subunit UvrA [Saccharibacillus sp. WB 17]MWJ30486.1 ATP-binding cassette domain-containing protein [Saccharibacillus sp. WB 17]